MKNEAFVAEQLRTETVHNFRVVVVVHWKEVSKARRIGDFFRA